MSTIMMHLSISNKPINYLCSFNRRKDSKACFVSSSTASAAATPLVIVRNCSSSLKCNAKVCDDDQNPIVRRTGNHKPPLWDFDYLQSLSSKYKEERYLKRATELIKQVKMMLLVEEEMKPIQQLELIDNLHRLGISYHFENEIDITLSYLYHRHHNGDHNDYYHQSDLYSTSLGFRLLRQHGFSVSQDVFGSFKNESGDFKASLEDDTRGLLQLYEASFLSIQGEKTLELARKFSTNLLQKKLDRHNDGIYDAHDDDDDHVLLLMVGRALELPIHWRVQRPNARWFIEEDYGKRPNMNPILLELAKLDFNIVQATHQQELKHVSSWWEKTCIAKILPFARDRLVENYLWTTAIFDDPQNESYSRIMATKVNVFILLIDDIFDRYGTLEELQLFNDVIQRWDIEAIDKLPHYMQICFLALNNFVDELSYHVLKQQGFLTIPHLRKSWADLCNTFLQEAKWHSIDYTPTLGEYIDNAWISSSAPVMLSHAFFLVTNPINKESAQSLYEYHTIVRCPSMILRLANDLGTSLDEMKRGDVRKSVQCYMNESGADRKEAQEYIRTMMCEAWNNMNGELRVIITDSPFQRDFMRSAVNLGRMAHYMYQHGDGHGIQFPEMKDRISSLLFEPFCVETSVE